MAKTKEQMIKIVRNETPEVVATLMESMAEHIEQQKTLIEQLRIEQAEKDQKNFNIEEKLKLLRRNQYGRSSEVRPDATDRPRCWRRSEMGPIML